MEYYVTLMVNDLIPLMLVAKSDERDIRRFAIKLTPDYLTDLVKDEVPEGMFIGNIGIVSVQQGEPLTLPGSGDQVGVIIMNPRYKEVLSGEANN